MIFPTTALDPDNRVVSILVTPDGKLVTDASPKPENAKPIVQVYLRVDESGNLELA
jgi:hypothetical protein